jgi:hypothetical protein
MKCSRSEGCRAHWLLCALRLMTHDFAITGIMISGAPVRQVSRHELNLLSDSRPHQVGGGEGGTSVPPSANFPGHLKNHCWTIASAVQPYILSVTNLPPTPTQPQGLVLDCSPLQWTPLDEFPHASQVQFCNRTAPDYARIQWAMQGV